MNKKYLLFLIPVLLLLANFVWGSALAPLYGGTGNTTSTIGSAALRWNGWFKDLDVTTLTVSGTASGNLDMNNNLILNIGAAGTDFTSGGGLNIATNLDVTATTTSGMLNVGSGKLYVGENGNAGIASSTPSDVLSVQGNIISSGDVKFYGTSATTTIGGGLDVNAGVLHVDPYNNRVGVNLSTPNYPLDVTGNINASGQFSLQGGGVLTYTVGNLITVGDTGNNGYMLALKGQSKEGARVVSTGIGFATTSARYKLDVWGNASFGTTTTYSVPLMFVDSGNGRIGIGTSTPSDTFSIHGYMTSRATYGSLAEETPGLNPGWTMSLGAIGVFTGWSGASSTISEASDNITLAGTSNGTATSTITLGAGASGKYQIMYSISLSIDTANQEVHCAVFKNGTKLGRASSEMKMTTVNDVKELSGIGIMSLFANDVIDLRCADETAANKVITVYHAGLVVNRIGLP